MSRESVLAGAARRRAAASAVLAVNRMVWALTLGVWVVVLAAGSYLGRVHLQSAGALSLAATGAVGLVYVLSHGRREHRLAGVAANALLGAELVLYFAGGGATSAARLLAGAVAALLLLGLPLCLLLTAPPADA